MSNKKLEDLTALTTVLDTDLVEVLSDPASTKLSRKATRANFLGNTDLTMLSGKKIKTDTIAETTGGAGVTIDGVLNKDGGIVTTGDIYTTATTDIKANVTGFAAGATYEASYKKIGKSVFVVFIAYGTKDGTTSPITITGLPTAAAIASNSTWHSCALMVKNNNILAYNGDATITSGATTLTITQNNDNFLMNTACSVRGFMWYEAA